METLGNRVDGGPTGRSMGIGVKRRCWGRACRSTIAALNRNCYVDLWKAMSYK